MIDAFLASWPLLHNAYLVGWLCALLLSLVGVVVVARNQVFVGAALAQASTLGIALALWLGELGNVAYLRGEAFKSGMAVACAVAAALAVELAAERTRESKDALLGWIFLLAASMSVLLLAQSPHRLEEIHGLVASSILGAQNVDVAVFAAATLAVGATTAAANRRIILLILDIPMADAVGIRTRLWTGGIAVVVGLVIGLALRATGLLYTFGCLVLPPIAARSVCNKIAPMFVVAPILSLATAVLAFLIANVHDYPPAQVTVALQALVVLTAWTVRRHRRGAA